MCLVSEVNRRWVVCGGIGSGKSTVRGLLERAGVPTVDSDAIGHTVIAPGGAAFAQVAERWPEVVEDGVIDRGALAGIVFNDPGELASLERITHPHIFDTISGRVQKIAGVVVVEIPVLRHGMGGDWSCMVVDARDDIRLARAVARGGAEDDVKARMASQPARSEWLAVADLVVPNNGSLEELADTVSQIIPWL